MFCNPINNIKPENKLKFIQHSIRFYYEPKIKKPNELRGVRQSFSIPYIRGKCTCPAFIHGDNVWLKHNDYFSETMVVPDDEMGMPLEYMADKYCEGYRKRRFVYSDAWGSIVLRNQAWIKLENLAYNIKKGVFELDLLSEILRQQELVLDFDKYELEDTNMSRMYEGLVSEVKRLINIE